MGFLRGSVYAASDITPLVAHQVLYFLTAEEYARYGVQSATATVTAVHTATSIDLQVTFVTKGATPGQTVTLTKLNVTYGNTQTGNWCEVGGYGGVLPPGSPW